MADVLERLNMIIDPAVQGRVNVLLTDVPWDQALEQILRSNKLGYTVEGNIIRIAPLNVLADEQAQQQKLTEAKALAGELRVQTFPLSYAKADALSPVLLKAVPISSRGQINVDQRLQERWRQRALQGQHKLRGRKVLNCHMERPSMSFDPPEDLETVRCVDDDAETILPAVN